RQIEIARGSRMRSKTVFCCVASLFLAACLPAQVTHGQKPKLPAPFATKSAGNGPDRVKPPEGFLPTVPAGFTVNVYASGFKMPRFLTVEPNKDILMAETGFGEILVLRGLTRSTSGHVRQVADEWT